MKPGSRRQKTGHSQTVCTWHSSFSAGVPHRDSGGLARSVPLLTPVIPHVSAAMPPGMPACLRHGTRPSGGEHPVHHQAVTETVPPTITVIHRDHGPVFIHGVLRIRLQSLDPGPGDITDVTTSHHAVAASCHTVSLLPESVLPATLHPFSGPLTPFPAPHLPVPASAWCISLAFVSTHFSLEGECPCDWDLRDPELFLADLDLTFKKEGFLWNAGLAAPTPTVWGKPSQ